MNREITPNAQAILLLTARLLAGKSRNVHSNITPLTSTAYNKLVRLLRDKDMKPADLLNTDCLQKIEDDVPTLEIKQSFSDIYQLLNRGFILSRALEHWASRAIWVVTRADDHYPRRLKQKMKSKAPPVLYGCGDRSALEGGGLAVVGSRRVNEELIEYTEKVGHLAAEAKIPIVSGGARGVDQAAMRGSLSAGGYAVGVLGNGLEQAALNRDNREYLIDERLVLISAFDPASRFQAWQAMDRNKQIYALADAALIVNSDHGHGGTWKGAIEQLGTPAQSSRCTSGLHYVSLMFVRDSRKNDTPSIGLEALMGRGARRWPDPEDVDSLKAIMVEQGEVIDASDTKMTNPDPQGNLFPQQLIDTSGHVVREHNSVQKFTPVQNSTYRLLSVMTRKMTRHEILQALERKDWGNVNTRYIKPCLNQKWIAMTIPNKPSSRNQHFFVTDRGRQHLASLHRKELLLPK